jgi:hypothetical protein
MFHKGPSYSIRKDKSNCFDQETKEQRRNPGPGTYDVRKFITKEEQEELDLKRRNGIDRTKLPKRPMFMDDDLKRVKGLPAPGQYAPKPLKATIGSVAMVLDRVSFLDDAILNSEGAQGPGQYDPNVSSISFDWDRKTM